MATSYPTSENRTALLQRIAAWLLDKQWHVSAAESCTGGGIAHAFTDLAGSSNWFEMSWVTYSNEAKQQCVGVSATTLEQHGAVSEQTVKEMALGACKQANSQCAVAVSGIAGPGGGTPSKPVGLVWFGLAIDGQVFAMQQQFSGDRHSVREQSIDAGLQFLYQGLVDYTS